MRLPDEVFQGGHPRHVHQLHIGHVQDEHAQARIDGVQGAQGLLRGAEKQGAVDVVDQEAGQLRAPGTGGLMVAQQATFGKVDDALDEQDRRQAHADGHRNHHVEQDGQAEAGQQHHHIAAGRMAQYAHEVPGFAHVPGRHQQQAGQRGHGQIGQQVGQGNHRKEYDAGMADTGQRRVCAGANVGRGAGDGSGSRHTAEERRDQVAQALPDQFGIGVMARPGHAVGHHRAQQ